jgi:hypothetical protein
MIICLSLYTFYNEGRYEEGKVKEKLGRSQKFSKRSGLFLPVLCL